MPGPGGDTRPPLSPSLSPVAMGDTGWPGGDAGAGLAFPERLWLGSHWDTGKQQQHPREGLQPREGDRGQAGPVPAGPCLGRSRRAPR